MGVKFFFMIFITVFCAELGDKTQLATLLFAADRENSKFMVFLAAATALIVSSGLAVLIESSMGRCVNPKYLSWIAGVGFIIIGLWTVIKA
jgi:putative Ca2+/H+ antiporter (TMEM165/GDT1 family)